MINIYQEDAHLKPNNQDYTIHKTDELINVLTNLAISGCYVFRGYSLQEQLLPSIFRRNMTDAEIELLIDFEKYGSQYFLARTPIDFISTAQHFGLPTRLLDFTYNPFIALYFALFTPKGTNAKHPEDKDFYYIRYCNIKDQLCFNQLPIRKTLEYAETGSLSKQSGAAFNTLKKLISDLNSDTSRKYLETTYWDTHLEEYFDEKTDVHNVAQKIDDTIDKFRTRKLLFIDANQCNQRIIMQQGLFLFPYELNADKLLEMMKANTNVIKVDKSLRIPLQQYLNTIGINGFRLMPDLSSVCEAVERQTRDRKGRGRKSF